MAEGLSASRLEEMEREWSALHADRAQTARSLLEAADMYLKIGDRARALEQVKRALQSSPLSVEAHRRYWSLQLAQHDLGEPRVAGG